jgi:D-3-phosphoglycerate dehydrogenase / 2-oxoglutarate reductase
VCALDPFVPAPVLADAGVSPCADLPELLQTSQILSLHVPLTAQTRGLIGAAQLALLPAGAILINTARGPLVNESAVLAALESSRLAGAGLDVWEHEPTQRDNPLFRHPRVVATPHMAAYTDEGRRRSHVAAAQLVLAALRGEPPATLLDPAVWSRRRTPI